MLTPVSKRTFLAGALIASHAGFRQSAHSVAMETKTPIIDVTKLSEKLLGELGENGSSPLFMVSIDGSDNTHMTHMGADRIAGLIVEGMRTAHHPLVDCLIARKSQAGTS